MGEVHRGRGMHGPREIPVCGISVVIVNWNGMDHVLDCLRSIHGQGSSLPMEIIVVDNGSTDGSADAVAREFPSVKLIRNDENLGFARANNIGIRASRGRYVGLVNSDVVVRPGCFDSLTRLLDEHGDIGLAAPRILGPDGAERISCGELPGVRSALYDAVLPVGAILKSRSVSRLLGLRAEYTAPTDVQMLSGCFWFARREAIDEVGLLDERFFIYSEDCDWCKRFHESRWRVVFSPEAEAVHLGEGSSSNAPTRFYLEMQRSRFAYWQKHHGAGGKAFYAATLVLHEVIQLTARAALYVVDPGRRAKHRTLLGRSVKCLYWVFCPRAAGVPRI